MSDVNKYLRVNVTRGLENDKSVDREKNIIYGFAVMTKGFVKDCRGWEIDDMTLDQVVKSGNSLKTGVKARFGHPNMSSTAFGSYIGRAKKFRKDGDVVRADLHISDTAFDTPNGDLGTYVLEMAEKEPDMFGSSIVLADFDFEYRLEKDGTRQKDKHGNSLPPLLRIKKISAADIVDTPAANSGMFAQQFFPETVKPSAEFTEFLDKFLSNENAVDNVISFLTRYASYRDDIDLNKTTQIQGDQNMDLEKLTIEELEKMRPDIVEAFKTRFSAPSVEPGSEQPEAGAPASSPAAESDPDPALEERKRTNDILGLLSVQEYSQYSEIAFKAIEEGVSFDVAESRMKDKRIKDLEAGAPKTPGPSNGDATVELSSIPDGVERWKAEFSASPDLKAEFGTEGAYVAFQNAKKRGAVKMRNK